MIRDYVTSIRSQFQSTSRRVLNNVGLFDDSDDEGTPIQNRIFNLLKRKFGDKLPYVIFSSALLFFFLVSLVAQSIEDNSSSRPTAASIPVENKTLSENSNSSNSNNLRSDNNIKANTVDINFLTSLFLTFFAWLSLINLLRYLRSWVLARTTTATFSGSIPSQREHLLMLQRFMQLSGVDSAGLPSRLRLAILQRDFNGDDYEMLRQLDNDNILPTHRIATDAQIDRMPLHTITQSELSDEESGERQNSSSNTSCNICLAPYEVGEEVRTVRCLHRFHKGCIDQWLRMNAVCPVCKHPAIE